MFSPSSLVTTQASLLQRFQQAGGLNLPLETNPEIIAIQREGLDWLREARRQIDTLLSAPIPSPNAKFKNHNSKLPFLLTRYDTVYRIVYGHPDGDYIRQARIQALQRWLKGDTTLSRTDVTLMILHEADRDNRTLDNRYSLFALGILQEWVDELTLYGRFRGIPAPEAHRRLDYILSAPLHAYLGPDETRLKARWAKSMPQLNPKACPLIQSAR